MKVELARRNERFHFEARDSEGRIINMDCDPKNGGEGKGTRPTELLLMAAGGCASIDLGLILSKMRQKLDDYKVEVSGERHTDEGKAFKSIHFSFKLWGEIETDKLEKAIELTINKYCSVILSLDQRILIDYNYKINPK